jgi:DNA-binding response OmpR family regulator
MTSRRTGREEPVSDRKTVLLVEDDGPVRHLIRVTLEANDYEVVEARDGVEGLQLLERHRPEAVVLDLMMPDLGGERLLARLRAAPETTRTPVLIITGKPEAALEMVTLVGRDNFFPKPFDPDALADRVKALLG